MFTLSAFADEISADLATQIKVICENGVRNIEVRGIDARNIVDFTPDEAREIKKTLDENGVGISSVGSPIGKIKITDAFEPEIERLKNVIELAHIFETKFIRIFSFYIPEGEEPSKYRDEVMRRMKAMCELAEKEGVILLHENEKDIYGDTAQRCKDIFDTVKSPALGGVFDPANFVQCGQVPYPDAFELLKDHILYMHIKDAVKDGTVVPAGYGIGGIREILTELKRMGYSGFLSLEPHLGSFAGLAALEIGDDMLKLSESNPEKFVLALESLRKIIDEI